MCAARCPVTAMHTSGVLAAQLDALLAFIVDYKWTLLLASVAVAGATLLPLVQRWRGVARPY